jgi:hypothetical protein
VVQPGGEEPPQEQSIFSHEEPKQVGFSPQNRRDDGLGIERPP